MTLIWASFMVTLPVSTADLPFDGMGLYYMIAALPHMTFTIVTKWITDIITLERSFSVVAPLKVIDANMSFSSQSWESPVIYVCENIYIFYNIYYIPRRVIFL